MFLTSLESVTKTKVCVGRFPPPEGALSATIIIISYHPFVGQSRRGAKFSYSFRNIAYFYNRYACRYLGGLYRRGGGGGGSCFFFGQNARIGVGIKYNVY